MKKILFVLRKPPHSGAYTQEMLDIIMTAAAFDQEVSVLLLDNAVFHSKDQQQPEAFGLKNTLAIFKALPLYEIPTIFVETESIQERGLSVDDLDAVVQEILRKNVGEFFNQFGLILSG